MNTAELEYRLLYSMVVAGKSATFAENVMDRFLQNDKSPFALIRELEESGQLKIELQKARSGNYDKLTMGFAALAHSGIDLEKCTALELEAIHGIGPKTSRFFIIWTRPDAKHAALDTHILKWLRYLGHDAPKATPSGAKYAALEKIILQEADKRSMTPRDLDAQIWDYCSKGLHQNGEWPTNLQLIAP